MGSRFQSKKVSVAIGSFLIGSLLPCRAATGKAPITDPPPLQVYHSFIPLGSETFTYSTRWERQIFYVMAAAQGGEFEGERVCLDGEKRVLRTAAGNPVQQYPQQLRFRVSVGEPQELRLIDSPLPVETHTGSFNQLILGLKFEVRIYHALTSRILRPAKITQIGVPPEIASSERVYDVVFDLGDVPIADRIVLHVLTDEGERLAKFNFDLY